MNGDTIRALNSLNRQFYNSVGDEFDATRGQPWRGWKRLPPLLPPGKLNVLDIGCGNGRLGKFLAEGRPLRYHGVDNSPLLLERARAALSPLPDTDLLLEERDIVTDGLDAPEALYDLVALFGVLHHIPGGDARRALVKAAAARVRPGGPLAFASWRFYDVPRLRERIIPFPPDLAPHVEANDYLLDWRRGDVHALRYCHYIDDTEQDALIAATDLTPVLAYRADGQTGDLNAYAILRRTIL